MGVSRTVEQLVNKLDGAARGLNSTGKIAVRAAAVASTAIIRDQVRSVAPSGRLRGVGKSGAAVGVTFVVLGGADPTAIVKATGPMQLIERDTKPHREPRERTKRSRRAIKVLHLESGAFRGSVNHPMTHGQHPFARGARRSEPIAMAAFARGVRLELARAFK